MSLGSGPLLSIDCHLRPVTIRYPIRSFFIRGYSRVNDPETRKGGKKKKSLPLCIRHPRNEMTRLVILTFLFVPSSSIHNPSTRITSRLSLYCHRPPACFLRLALRCISSHQSLPIFAFPFSFPIPVPFALVFRPSSSTRGSVPSLAMSPCSLSSSLPSFLPLWSMLLSRPPCENIPMTPSRLRRMALAKRMGALARLRLGSRGSANSKDSKKVRDSGCAVASDEVAICLCMAGDGREMGDDGPVAEEGAAGIRLPLARCWC